MRTITPDTDMYGLADIIIKYLVKEYVEMFDDFRGNLLQKDELNILTKVNDLYEKLAELTKQKMLELAQLQFEYIMQGDFDYSLIDSSWLQELLETYNPVTKYVYANEIERKCAYLYEALMSGDTSTDDIDKALRLWSLMVGQMAIDVVDKATNTAYKLNGVVFVIWVTEDDDRRCEECAELDGQVFPIDETPEKPHLRCRCFTIPVTGG